MHDEAAPFYVEMVDQTTRGHQFLAKNFGDMAIPKGTWQIDPFGHSNTEAWLLGAEAGTISGRHQCFHRIRALRIQILRCYICSS